MKTGKKKENIDFINGCVAECELWIAICIVLCTDFHHYSAMKLNTRKTIMNGIVDHGNRSVETFHCYSIHR